jgi:hypothetical protein
MIQNLFSGAEPSYNKMIRLRSTALSSGTLVCSFNFNFQFLNNSLFSYLSVLVARLKFLFRLLYLVRIFACIFHVALHD